MKPGTFSFLTRHSFQEYPNNSLFYDVTKEASLTYSEGDELIKLIARKFINAGFKRGEMILTYTPLSVESVVLCWACFLTGIVFVPVDHNWPEVLLKHIIRETNPLILLTDPERIDNVKEFLKTDQILITGENTPDEKFLSFFHWVENNEEGNLNALHEPESTDLAVILYTSGSTGLPKGVMLSQQAIFNSGKLIASKFEWNQKDIFYNLGDLHSMSGLRNTCFTPLHAGASFLITSYEERNSAVLTLNRIKQSEVTFVGAAPSLIRQFNILFSESRKHYLDTLKAILCTGGPLAQDQLELFYMNYHKPVLNYYGLTETAGICTAHDMKTFNPADNSIGKAVGADLVIDHDFGSNDTDSGELMVGSANLMLGYYKREEETSQVLVNGYLRTGDLVKRRDDGCIVLLGRKRNIVKSIYSELICLEEIDSALESHPLVMEACTCIYSRFEEDEKIVAFIVLNENSKQDLKDSIAIIKNDLIRKAGKLRVPWCYFIEQKLPHNTAGKILRPQLQEKLIEYIKTDHERYY